MWPCLCPGARLFYAYNPDKYYHCDVMSEKGKKTLVIGASLNPARQSNFAVRNLDRLGHDVIAVGLKPGTINEVPIQTEFPKDQDIHTITLYLNATHQDAIKEFLLTAHVKRVIFNPGAENKDLMNQLRSEGVHAFEACTMVMLNTGQY